MPPRHVYWTIIAGGQPTAFRAAEREELLPTLKQLQSRHPDATLMWFARGKLWPTKEAAEFALRQERGGGERRGRDWRPGGEHKDPRDRFKVPRDVKRQRFAQRARRDNAESGRPDSERPWKPKPDGPQGARPVAPRADRPQGERPFKPREERQQGDRPFKPREDRPQGDRPFKPRGDRPQGERPFKPREDRPRGDRPFRPNGERPRGDRPVGDRPFRPKGHRPGGDRPFRPQGERPFRPKGSRPPGAGFKPRGPRGGGRSGGGGGRGPK